MRLAFMNSYAFQAFMYAVAIFVVCVRFLPFSWNKKEDVEAKTPATEADPEKEKAETVDLEHTPDQLVVKHLNHGMATLMLRERSRHRKCTSHLIVWAGKKKKGRKVLVEDSHYDLGYVDGSKLTDEIVASFLVIAEKKLGELVVEGMKKQRRKKAAPVADARATEVPAVELEASAPPIAIEQSAITVEENEPPGPAIKMKRYPSVFRGKVLEMGRMPKTGRDGDFMCYGVRYRTPEGIEDVVWGVNLRTAFHDARAGVNDEVEILKIGRKTVEEGKAPMNMYKVTKLSKEQVTAQ